MILCLLPAVLFIETLTTTKLLSRELNYIRIGVDAAPRVTYTNGSYFVQRSSWFSLIITAYTHMYSRH